ncbi:MAG: hypothetical protein JO319_01825 [Acidobacteriaceae bacterium]|nr:hypothetical protein [Acidobacteriaceae bacterium]
MRTIWAGSFFFVSSQALGRPRLVVSPGDTIMGSVIPNTFLPRQEYLTGTSRAACIIDIVKEVAMKKLRATGVRGSMLRSCSGIATAAALIVGIAAITGTCRAQANPKETPPPQPGTLKTDDTKNGNSNPPESKRIFWIIPNYRTSPSLHPYVPLTAKEKFTIATKDAFDRGTFILAALFAGQGQLTNSNPSFGQGAAGYARYFGTSCADWVIGDYMTEAIYPVMLHQDPRYFRNGKGGRWSRLGYAMSQVVITHGDSGKTQFNFSEIVGNSTAVAISEAYYPDNRDWQDAVSRLGSQVGVDMAANVLKEFWPDLERKFGRKKHE